MNGYKVELFYTYQAGWVVEVDGVRRTFGNVADAAAMVRREASRRGAELNEAAMYFSK